MTKAPKKALETISEESYFPLNPDGSLDVKAFRNLPFDQFTKAVTWIHQHANESQRKDYNNLGKDIVNQSKNGFAEERALLKAEPEVLKNKKKLRCCCFK